MKKFVPNRGLSSRQPLLRIRQTLTLTICTVRVMTSEDGLKYHRYQAFSWVPDCSALSNFELVVLCFYRPYLMFHKL